jgi:cystathionine gamma-synthase
MVVVTVLSKQPPGGRCSLYLRYAETLRERFGLDTEVRHREGEQASEAPALLVEGAPVEPADGVIVAPEDLAHSLRGRFDAATIDTLISALNETQEDWMEEWSDGQ